MAKDKPITEQEIEVATEVAKLMIELDDKELELNDLKELVDLLDKEL
jgi:hypothetical protein